MVWFEDRINFAVFPSLQGGPHNNHTAALAIAFKQVASPEYKAYIQQVKKNAQALASVLLRRKCRLVTGSVKILRKICEMCYITLNKSAIFGDNGAISPGGVRIGTPAMTSRGCVEADFETIADFLLRAAQIASGVQREHGKLQKDFIKGVQNNILLRLLPPNLPCLLWTLEIL
ncbi:serine hydroxymethyltransferase 7-like [Aristolochia californica]|uniref:serine hydroxymethyltransferase 7-like n=1 Tax=Aristolochia californica TaxID=171875 RepID=UPI0035D6E825